MSNCFSLTSAEPFFNLLTARGEEEEEEEEREMEERKEESLRDKNESISEFFCKVREGVRRSEKQRLVDDEASFFFFPFLLLSSQPGVVRSEGGPRCQSFLAGGRYPAGWRVRRTEIPTAVHSRLRWKDGGRGKWEESGT
ncbi:hypothetical protein EYF80_033414 [Liparis tanakae]|uniref:Uncharacterized protein n=1 Tax=Liparis tanakae TaxID=230148 RepID=A0A4Z2GRU4_9TELE|nr:hypothetical protein EYF80_033414 [Liparis tanakae]